MASLFVVVFFWGVITNLFSQNQSMKFKSRKTEREKLEKKAKIKHSI